MKKITLLFLVLVGPHLLPAQSLRQSMAPMSLDLGQANEIDEAQTTFTLNNPSTSAELQVNGVLLLTHYRDTVFSLSDTSFAIGPGGSKSLKVSFLPEHNIAHNSELVLKTNSPAGNLAIDLKGQGIYSKEYYSATRNKSGEALKNALKSQVTSTMNNNISYDQARDWMYEGIDGKPNGTGQFEVEGVYTGRPATYDDRQDIQNQDPRYDTEHTFPQGMFNQDLPMRSDLFHLYPTVAKANNGRGNLPFGEVTSGDDGSGEFWSPSKRNSQFFEPRDVQKGNSARAMFYFVLRYRDYNNFYQPQEQTLRQWHWQDPPDAEEKERNREIFEKQGNRNPFIDYPQFWERLGSLVSETNPSGAADWQVPETSMDFSFDYQVGDTLWITVLNSGEEPLDLSNFQPNPGDGLGSYSPAKTSLSIAPHEAEQIPLLIESLPTQEGDFTLDFELFGTQTARVSVENVPTSLSPAKKNSQQLKLYPNPSGGQAFLDYPAGTQRIRLLNEAGQTLKLWESLPAKPGTLEITTEGLPAGLYLLEVKNQKGQTQQQRLLLE